MRSMYLLFSLGFLCTYGTSSLYSMEAPENFISKEESENKQTTFGEPFTVDIQQLYSKALETDSLLLLICTYAQLLYNNKEKYSTLNTLAQTFLEALKIQLENIAKKAGRFYGEKSKPMDYQKCVTVILKSLKAEELAAEVYTFLKSRPQTSNIIALLMGHIFTSLEKSPAFCMFMDSSVVTLVLKNEAFFISRLRLAYYNEQAKIRCSALDIFKAEPQAFEQVYSYVMLLQKGSLTKEEVPASEQLEDDRDFLDLNAMPIAPDMLSMLSSDSKEETLEHMHDETEDDKELALTIEHGLWVQGIAQVLEKKGIQLVVDEYESQLIQGLTSDELSALHSFVQAHDKNASMPLWNFIAYKIGGLSSDIKQMVFDIIRNEKQADLVLLEDMIAQLQ
jgi:hypothetical protein